VKEHRHRLLRRGAGGDMLEDLFHAEDTACDVDPLPILGKTRGCRLMSTSKSILASKEWK
jgi:hypothetical protein